MLNKIRLDKTPRKEQLELLDFASKTVLSNKKFICINAPTGCLTKNEKINIYILKDIHINHEQQNRNNKCD